MLIRLIAVLFLINGFTAAAAQELEGDYLYRVEAIRAAPGKFEALLEWAEEARDSGYFEDNGEPYPFIMRHSQGDQWDLLVIRPMESWRAYHARSRTAKRKRARAAHDALLKKQIGLIAFEEDHFAYGPPIADMISAFTANGFFHIEMFAAVAGKEKELLEQRRMENSYLIVTGQTPNMIFRRAAGSDIDVFTIGFHKSLETFAAPAPVTIDEKEAAAKASGFEDLADISFYLRSLISSHHDTLAVKVD